MYKGPLERITVGRYDGGRNIQPLEGQLEGGIQSVKDGWECFWDPIFVDDNTSNEDVCPDFSKAPAHVWQEICCDAARAEEVLKRQENAITFNSWQRDLIEKSKKIMHAQHNGQLRKWPDGPEGKEKIQPETAHTMEVAAASLSEFMAYKNEINEEDATLATIIICSALLHDVNEIKNTARIDVQKMLSGIHEKTAKTIADIVERLSEYDKHGTSKRKGDQSAYYTPILEDAISYSIKCIDRTLAANAFLRQDKAFNKKEETADWLLQLPESYSPELTLFAESCRQELMKALAAHG